MIARISGAFETQVGKLPGQTPMSLAAAAATGALREAGLGWNDVDALITTTPVVDPRARQALALGEYFGILGQLSWASTVSVGGASPLTAIVEASRLVADGTAQVVVVVAADAPRTGHSRTATVDSFAKMRNPYWEQPYGLLNVGAYALLASNYLDRFGLGPEVLAPPAVAMREMARSNPAAIYRDPLTVDDVLESRLVSDPLRLLECSPISDGGAAVVVTRDGDGPRVLGWGHGYQYDSVSFAKSPYVSGCGRAAEIALRMADVSLNELDVAFLYDSYSIALLYELEEIGFCEAGSGADYIASGGIGMASALPINTHGGLLSHAHIGGGAGMNHVVEAVRQFVGTSANQVEGVERVLVHNEGGILSAHCCAVLGR